MGFALQALVIEYRTPVRTIACVKALLAQGIKSVHVFDNSADEGTTRAILVQAFYDEARVSILDAGGNLGFAAGVNLGLSQRSAEWVLLINNDAIPQAGVVKDLTEALLSDTKACIAFPSLIHAGEPMGRVFYHRWFGLVTSRCWPGCFEVPRGCCMLVALDRVPSMPLFDERFFMYGEEIALGWSLRQHGSPICHVDGAWVEHEGSAAAKRGSAFYEERTALAHILLSDVLAEGPYERAVMSAIRFNVLLLRAVVRAIKQRSLLPLHAVKNALGIARGQVRGSNPPI